MAAGPNAFWCYDVKRNEWLDLKPAGKPAKGCNRFGPNNAIVNYDSANDVVVMFYHRGPIAPPDGPRSPVDKARGIYIYDPAANTWAEQPLELHKNITMWPSGFYSADLNAHFFHVAQDSRDNGTMWVYRYKQAAGRK